MIEVGPEKLELTATAAFDEKGEYIGATAAWAVVTEKLATREQGRTDSEHDGERARSI